MKGDMNNDVNTQEGIASAAGLLASFVENVLNTVDDFRRATSIYYALTDKSLYPFRTRISAITYYEDEKKFCGEMLKTGNLHIFYIDPHRLEVEHGGSCAFNLENCKRNREERELLADETFIFWSFNLKKVMEEYIRNEFRL